ncbi:unnamed protein product, partial [Prorocentrum cordatum]
GELEGLILPTCLVEVAVAFQADSRVEEHILLTYSVPWEAVAWVVAFQAELVSASVEPSWFFDFEMDDDEYFQKQEQERSQRRAALEKFAEEQREKRRHAKEAFQADKLKRQQEKPQNNHRKNLRKNILKLVDKEAPELKRDELEDQLERISIEDMDCLWLAVSDRGDRTVSDCIVDAMREFGFPITAPKTKKGKKGQGAGAAAGAKPAAKAKTKNLHLHRRPTRLRQHRGRMSRLLRLPKQLLQLRRRSPRAAAMLLGCPIEAPAGPAGRQRRASRRLARRGQRVAPGRFRVMLSHQKASRPSAKHQLLWVSLPTHLTRRLQTGFTPRQLELLVFLSRKTSTVLMCNTEQILK